MKMSNSQFTDTKQGDTLRVIQVDGNPTSYFEQEENGEVQRIHYRVLACASKDFKALSKWIFDTTRKIENAVFNTIEVRNVDDKTGVIVWRKRPSIDVDDSTNLNYHYVAYMRVATIPQLTEETWLDIGHVKKEGEPMEMLK
jgi:hypothetical protein